jgi:protein-tyrosine phosphatase
MIDYHEGELADPRMRKHAFDRGYKLTHRSRPVVERDFYEFDYMVVMDEDNVRRLQRLQPNGAFKAKLLRMADFLQNYDYAYIPDPYYGDASDFELVINLLEDASPALWEHVRAEMHGEG